MREIPLTQGRVALVDDADYEWLMQWKWQAHKCKNLFYATRSVQVQNIAKEIRMHRVILQAPDGVLVDHEDSNGLNNQRYNLRCCTNSQNCCNRKRALSACGYKGVTRASHCDNRWAAKIKIHRKNYHIGQFATDEHTMTHEDAIELYHEATKLTAEIAEERDLLRECNAADTAWREGYMLTTPAGIIDALTTRVEQARAALAAFDAAHTTEGDPSTKGA